MVLDLGYNSNGALSEDSYNKVIAIFHLYKLLTDVLGIDLERAIRILEGKEYVKQSYRLKIMKAYRRIRENPVLTAAEWQELGIYL